MSTPLEARITEAYPRLSARRQQLLRSILDNPDETFFLSSRKMAERLGVDPATLVRTLQTLGYEKFADFAADLREHFVQRVTPYTVMQAAVRERRPLEDQVLHSLDRDLENLSTLRSQIDPGLVEDLARQIHGARRILVLGIDLAAALSSFLAYGLSTLGFDAEAPLGTTGNLQYKLRLLGPDDLLIAISFRRCLRETVEAVIRCRERGIATFAITDSDATPLAQRAASHLVARIASPAFTGSYVAPMGLINAILVACAHLQTDRSLAVLRQTQEEYEKGSRWYK